VLLALVFFKFDEKLGTKMFGMDAKPGYAMGSWLSYDKLDYGNYKGTSA